MEQYPVNISRTRDAGDMGSPGLADFYSGGFYGEWGTITIRTVSISICVIGKIRFTLYHIHSESVAFLFAIVKSSTRTIPPSHARYRDPYLYGLAVFYDGFSADQLR